MDRIVGGATAPGKKIAIVLARWNELVVNRLLEGALDEIARSGAAVSKIVQVPGSWEIPVAVKTILDAKDRPDAIVALGCILQGETPHARLLGADVAGALMGLQVEYKTPIAWGVLTPDTVEQALDRSGMKHGNKGREAALSAIEMIDLLGKL